MDYLRYAPNVETIAPDEDETFAELSATMQHITRTMAGRYRHAYRPVHAKSHGVLVGRLEVQSGLPPELAQGLFANAGSFGTVMRFSTNPGDMLADNVSTPRGLAIKVVGAHGDKVRGHENAVTQDFVCINTYAFGAPDPKAFVKQIKLFDKNLETSEGVKHAVSVGARAANAVLRTVHLSSATLEGVGAPATHILGESFSIVAPIRYGDYVAKIDFVPSSENLKALTGKHVDLGDYNALTLMIQDFFAKETAVWDVRAQLALATDDFPIEKADREWPQEKSPFRVVGKLVVEAQNTYSDERQLYVDERFSFTPWHALAAHQPLGGIMRARRPAYREAIEYRTKRNDRQAVEPTSIDQIPA